MMLNKKAYLIASVALLNSPLVAQKITDYVYPFVEKGKEFTYEDNEFSGGDSIPQISYFSETLSKTFIKDGCYAFEVDVRGTQGMQKIYYKADKSFKKIFEYATTNNRGEYKEDSTPVLFAWLPDNAKGKKKWTVKEGDIIRNKSCYFDSIKVGNNSHKFCLILSSDSRSSLDDTEAVHAYSTTYFVENVGLIGGDNDYDDVSGNYKLVDTLLISSNSIYTNPKPRQIATRGQGYDLSDRQLLVRPPLAVSEPVQGQIVVNIAVDQDGNVIEATPGASGTTINNDDSLYKLVKDAALKTKFDKAPDGTPLQYGTITFKFSVQ